MHYSFGDQHLNFKYLSQQNIFESIYEKDLLEECPLFDSALLEMYINSIFFNSHLFSKHHAFELKETSVQITLKMKIIPS